MTSTNSVKFEHKFAVGAISGIVGTGVVYPFDIVKTNLQSQVLHNRKESIINSTLKIFRSIYQTNGMKGFYRGFSSCLIGIAPEKGIKLAVNDGAREILSIRNAGRLTTSHEIMAGSVAGIIQLIVTVPYEMVKIRLQMAHKTTTVLSVVKDLGFKGLYRGTVPTLFRDVPFCFIFFPLYANLKLLQTKYFVDETKKTSEPFHISLVSGIIAGAVSGALVTPADLIKTRVQQGLNGNMNLGAFVMNIARTEGLSTLYRGWHTRILVIAPLYGLVSLSYEVQKTWIMKRNI